MIIDHIANRHLCQPLSALIQRGLTFLQETDFTTLAPGRHDIEGDKLFAMVQDYQSKPLEEGVWEAHRRFIDIQYIVSGEERIGYTCLDNLTASQDYDQEKDCQFFTGTGDTLSAFCGTFLIFFPTDAHMPGLQIQGPTPVRKVVVKVLYEGAQ